MALRILCWLCLALSVPILAAAPALISAQEQPAEKSSLAGYWQGALQVGPVKLRIGVELTNKEGGGLTGKLDSPDQQVFGVAIDEVTTKDKTIKLVLKSIGGSYEGTVSDDGKEIKGTWSQGGGSLELVLKPGEKLSAPKRPQEPKPPFPYRAEEVSYENKEAGIKIAGTLTLPKEGGPFPVVLLITGSGPQDRNEELMGHKPFLMWADTLTRRGIAVLRVDDRGVGGTGGSPLVSTIEDHVGDALAGVAYLKSRADIDARRIGLMGHSEGGLVAPAAAVKSPDVAFIVMLAGTGVSGEEILYRQGDLIGKAMGLSDEVLARNKALKKKLFAILREESDAAAAKKRFEDAAAELSAALTEEERKTLEGAKEAGEAQVNMMLTPWFRHFLAYDPRPVLEKVACPVLAICGEKDLQVDPAQNLPPIEAALKAAGNKDYMVRELPGLNHLFQASSTGAISEYGEIEETINPAALILGGRLDRSPFCGPSMKLTTEQAYR